MCNSISSVIKFVDQKSSLRHAELKVEREGGGERGKGERGKGRDRKGPREKWREMGCGLVISLQRGTWQGRPKTVIISQL